MSMNVRASYSFACAAFAAMVTAGGLAGCFSEHVSVLAPTGQELCVGPQPPGVVRVVDFAFFPAQITVPKGRKVIWVNCSASATTHTSTSDTGVWNASLPQFATHEQTFDALGSFPYHCTPHPFMKGTIVVQP